MTKAHPRPPPCKEGVPAAWQVRPSPATKGRRVRVPNLPRRVAQKAGRRGGSRRTQATTARTGHSQPPHASAGGRTSLARVLSIVARSDDAEGGLLPLVASQLGLLVAVLPPAELLPESSNRLGNCQSARPLERREHPEEERLLPKTSSQGTIRRRFLPKEKKEFFKRWRERRKRMI